MLLTVRNNGHKRMLKLNLNFLPNVTWAKNFYYCQMFSLEIKYETNTETFKKWQTSVKIKDGVQQIGAENSINLLRFINHRKPLSISQLPQEASNNPVTTIPPHLSSPYRGLCCSTLVFYSLTSQVPRNPQIDILAMAWVNEESKGKKGLPNFSPGTECQATSLQTALSLSPHSPSFLYWQLWSGAEDEWGHIPNKPSWNSECFCTRTLFIYKVAMFCSLFKFFFSWKIEVMQKTEINYLISQSWETLAREPLIHRVVSTEV